jgi:hypothetical protein
MTKEGPLGGEITSTLHSTDPGWKPNTDVRPLLDFVEGLILDLARSHPQWTPENTAQVLVQVVAGWRGRRRAA